MPTVIELYGAPGAGKSRNAAKIFSTLKDLGYDCEIVQEYVKEWAWQGRKVTPLDQFYILGTQIQKTSMLYRGVRDFIVTDSPVRLVTFYSTLNNIKYVEEYTEEFYRLSQEAGINFKSFFILRTNPYSEQGRYQTEEESDEIAKKLISFLPENVQYSNSHEICNDVLNWIRSQGNPIPEKA